jgi:acetyl-CoA carboxylase biotin carboxyl carrier protein
MKKIKIFSDSDEENSMTSRIDYEEINKIIKLLEEKNLAEFELEVEGFKIKIARNAKVESPPQPPLMPPFDRPAPGSALPTSTGLTEPLAHDTPGPIYIVTSPMVGTFYRAPAPNSAPFVEIGEPVKKKQTLCIVEAMKLMNEIECEVDGLVKEIFVENGKPVEYGQKLFAIVPEA